MAAIRLITLGHTELTGPEGEAILSVLSQPKRFALLVYLAVEGSNGLLRRDKVVALFWPERDQSDARANLRRSLHYLRKSLGEDVILTRGDEEVGIDPSLLECDVLALPKGGEVPVEGTFLDGFHFSGASVEWEAWVDDVRERVWAHEPEEAEVRAPAGATEAPAPGDDRLSASPFADHPVARWQRMAFAATAVAVALAAGLLWTLRRDTADVLPTRYEPIRLGSGAQHAGVVHRHYALPPDGSGILFRDRAGGRPGSWWKASNALEPSYVEGLDRIAGPVFSADGAWIAFARDGELRRQPVAGGPSVLLADSASTDFSPGIAWLPDGGILYEDAGHDLRRARPDGSHPELVTTAAEVGEIFHVRAALDGSGAFVVGCDGGCDGSTPHLSWVDLEASTVTRLRPEVWMAWPMSDGRVVMVDGQGAVIASRFDRAAGVLEQPIPLLDGVQVSPQPDVVLGRDGSLLYIPGEVEPYGERLVAVERDGSSVLADPDWPASWRIRSLSLSPDDRRLALGMVSDVDPGAGEQVWIKELPQGALSPLTTGPSPARRPVWSPDGRTIAFVTRISEPDSTRSWVASTLPSDASSSEPELLFRHDAILEVVFSADWRTAVVRAGDAALGEGDIAFTSLGGGGDLESLFESEANEYSVALSPDGRWLAYVSEVSGRPEVYVRPVPGPGPRVQVSRDGGVEPRWAHSGEEIFFRSLRPDAPPDAATAFMVAARVSTDPGFRVESVDNLFATNAYVRGPHVPLYDVTTDNQRFVMVTHYGPRGWTEGEAVYSAGWYWSDEIQSKLKR